MMMGGGGRGGRKRRGGGWEGEVERKEMEVEREGER